MKQWLSEFKARQDREERMDQPDVSASEMARALAEIRWVNQYLGGTAAILDEIKKMPPSLHPLEILDLGTGSADIPRALVEWGRANDQKIRVTAVDLNPIVIREARQLSCGYPEIDVVEGDALALPYPDQSYDLVISSMFMHHLSDDGATDLIKGMARLCRWGFAVNDLERHPCAWLGIKLLGKISGKGAMFMNDAPLSVLKGFSLNDLKQLCTDAGFPECSIQKRSPFRWVITWKKKRHA